jgi:hypothetical protein
MRINTALLAAAALSLAACATAEQTSEQTAAMTPGEGRDCFRAASVSGYSVVDDHNIRVHVGPNRSYTMHTTWNANELDWTLSIALRSDTGWICTGRVLGAVEITGGTMGRTYPIQTVTRDPDPPGQQGS